MAHTGNSAERATERVAVLITSSEKAGYVDRPSGERSVTWAVFREAAAAYVSRDSSDQGSQEADDSAERCDAVEHQRAWLLDRAAARGSIPLASV